MSLNEAMAAFGPSWLQIWLPLLILGGFIAPLALLIWKSTRLIGAIAFVSSLIAGVGIDFMYKQMGYVKLLGLPHILLWTPLIVFVILQLRRKDFPVWPRRIMIFMVVIMSISLVFDYVDAIRYFMGNTTALVMFEPA